MIVATNAPVFFEGHDNCYVVQRWVQRAFSSPVIGIIDKGGYKSLVLGLLVTPAIRNVAKSNY